MQECSVEGCCCEIFTRGVCKKHYRLMRMSGEIKRTRYDKNEVINCGDHAVVYLYDVFGNKKAETKISVEDIDIVSKLKWGMTGAGYAHGSLLNGKKILLHRYILETGNEVDHINGDKLDNRRSNLREATSSQNKMNKGSQSNNNTGYKGIRRNGKGYCAKINANGENFYLGQFKNKEDAARAYDAAAKVIFGEFAVLNFTEAEVEIVKA